MVVCWFDPSYPSPNKKERKIILKEDKNKKKIERAKTIGNAVGEVTSFLIKKSLKESKEERKKNDKQ